MKNLGGTKIMKKDKKYDAIEVLPGFR